MSDVMEDGQTITEAEVRAALAQVKRELAAMICYVGGLRRPGQSQVDWFGSIAKLRADERELYSLLRDFDPSPF